MISDAAHPVPLRRRARTAAAGRLLARLAAVAGLVGLVGLMGAAPAAADAPGNLASEITDTAGVLGTDTARVQQALDTLRTDTGYQLFVAFVPTFDGLDGQSWADKAATASGFGRDDVLLAVAVDEGRYGFSVDDGIDAERRPARHGRADGGDAPARRRLGGRGDRRRRRPAHGGRRRHRRAPRAAAGSGLLVAAVIGVLVIALIWFLVRRRGAGLDRPGAPADRRARQAGQRGPGRARRRGQDLRAGARLRPGPVRHRGHPRVRRRARRREGSARPGLRAAPEARRRRAGDRAAGPRDDDPDPRPVPGGGRAARRAGRGVRQAARPAEPRAAGARRDAPARAPRWPRACPARAPPSSRSPPPTPPRH